MKPETLCVEKNDLQTFNAESEDIICVPAEVIPVFNSILEKMKQVQQQFIAVAEAMKPVEN